GGIEDPVMVSGTDGVGTKLRVAISSGFHDTIGFDLVGMCVNDVITTGARPLFFLDYFATGKLDVKVAESVVAGIAKACKEAGCALVGGETAELPGMYQGGDYDLAGFSVGIVARKKIVDGKRVTAGAVAIALPSSGLHSNGYSLARRVIYDTMKLEDDARPPELGGMTVAEALLTPTRLYPRVVKSVQDANIDVLAMSHITGGGLPGNVPRVLPEGLGLRIDHPPARAPIFELIQNGGPVEPEEMWHAFNCGVGFVFVVAKEDVDRTMRALEAAGEAPFVLGHVIAMDPTTPFEARVVLP
ncbi:MAG: phosphoribosylformylglycinamidine cyclo-ligase, partial [Polyangiaceae bacterium]